MLALGFINNTCFWGKISNCQAAWNDCKCFKQTENVKHSRTPDELVRLSQSYGNMFLVDVGGANFENVLNNSL